MEVSGQLRVPSALPQPGTHLKGGWVGPRAGLHAVAKRRNSLSLRGPARSLATVLTELPRLVP